MSKPIVTNCIKIGIVVGLMYYLLSSDQLEFKKLTLLWESIGITIGVIFAKLFIQFPIVTLRWMVFLKALRLPLPFRQVFIANLAGEFFNSTLPGSVSGDVIKGYYLHKTFPDQGRFNKVFTLLLDRIFGLYGLFLFAAIVAVVRLEEVTANPTILSLAFIIWGVSGGMTLGVGLTMNRQFHVLFEKIAPKLPGSRQWLNLSNAMWMLREKKRTMIFATALAVINQAVYVAYFLLLGDLIHPADGNYAAHIMVVAIGLISVAIPIAPAGIGIGHSAFAFLYSVIGVDEGANIFNLVVTLNLAFALMCSLAYLTLKADAKKEGDDLDLSTLAHQQAES